MRAELDKKCVMLPMLKMLWVFTLEVILHPVVEVKILNFTWMYGTYAWEISLLFWKSIHIQKIPFCKLSEKTC